MRTNQNVYSLFFIFILVFGVGSNANATSVALADAFFDFDSLVIDGDVYVDDAELDSFIGIANEDGVFDSSVIGDVDSSDALFGFNVDALAGNDGFDFLGASTTADSIFADLSPASAFSELTVFIPFENDSSGTVDISFDYGLFVTADTEATGEYAIASAGLTFTLLDEFLDSIDVITDDFFVEAFDGSFEDDGVNGFIDGSYSLDAGFYYVAIDLFADSFTEAFAPATAVPAPGTLVLMLAGLAFLNRRFLKNHFNKNDDDSVLLPSRVSIAG